MAISFAAEFATFRIEPLHSAACHFSNPQVDHQRSCRKSVTPIPYRRCVPSGFNAAAAHNVTGVPIKSRLPTSTPQCRKML